MGILKFYQGMAGQTGIVTGASSGLGVTFAEVLAERAVVNLTRALAVEWAKHGIYVKALAPSFFPSEMTEEVLKDRAIHDHIVSRTPPRTRWHPDDLKAALAFLTSPGFNYVTGQTLYLDGGWTAE